MSDRPVIVGVGNVLMGDDGAGVAALAVLRDGGAEDRADVVDAGLAFSEVLCDLDPARPLVVLDAVRGGGDPGDVYRLRIDDLDPKGASMAAAVSLHEVSILPALRMERLSGRDFNDVTIFGIEPGVLRWSEQLSPPVAGAVPRLADAVLSYLDERAAMENPSAASGSHAQ